LASNTIGNILKFTSFGESHGTAVGGVLDGFPAGITIDEEFIQTALNRRRPGQSNISTSRNESDRVEFLSGIFEGKSTGHPIAIFIRNADAKSEDYSELKELYRPSHADYTYQNKYGIRDYRGGGRSSARVTAAWVAAGAIAELLLKENTDINFAAYVSSVHQINMLSAGIFYSREQIDMNIVRCPDQNTAALMISEIEKAKTEGDSLGGIITCVIRKCPIGLGDPVFEKLNARLAAAMFSIPAVKGFEVGDGFDIIRQKGSEVNDAFIHDRKNIHTTSNHSGGIQGGISNGEDILFKVAFKPTSTISKTQNTVTKEGENTILSAVGRHDPCVLPRAVPIVEALTAFTLGDLYLSNRIHQK
jgi:chorismate synthase